MKFSKPITDIIRERTSWRTYSGQPLENDIRENLNKLLEFKNFTSPFSEESGKCRFELIGMPEFAPNEKKKIGIYGIIKGAQEFVVGAVEKTKYDRENYGYMMEAIILSATDMGLGTCWLGGFFNQSLFASKINSTPNEIVPAITPIGYLAEKRRAREKMIRTFIKADKRYPWDRLFFENNFSKPLVQEKAGDHYTLLEMVRLGPSASNKQPWRIVKESNKNIFHFYIVRSEDKRYYPFQRLDIGIAVCHFDLSAKELGMEGKWEFAQPDIPESEGFMHVISWIGS